MRGMRARGHEVIGVCAEGPLLDWAARRGVPRRSPCRWSAASRRWRIGAHSATWCGCSAPSGPTWCTRTCRSAASLRGWRPGGPACRASPTPATAFWFNYPGSWPRAAVGFAMEWLARSGHRRVPDGQRGRGSATRAVCTFIATPWRSATAATRRVSAPIPPARRRIRARTGRAGRSRGRARGVPAGAAQGLSRTGRRNAARCRARSFGWWASG